MLSQHSVEESVSLSTRDPFSWEWYVKSRGNRRFCVLVIYYATLHNDGVRDDRISSGYRHLHLGLLLMLRLFYSSLEFFILFLVALCYAIRIDVTAQALTKLAQIERQFL